MNTNKIRLKNYTLAGLIGSVILLTLSVLINFTDTFYNINIGFKYLTTIFTFIPISLYTVFFFGYFATQKSWTLFKKLFLGSIFCNIAFMLLTIIINIFLNNVSLDYELYYLIEILLSILINIKWILFFLGLSLYKNIQMHIKLFSIIITIIFTLRMIFAIILSISFLEPKLMSLFIFDIQKTAWLTSELGLLILLISIFIIQNINLKNKPEVTQYGN